MFRFLVKAHKITGEPMVEYWRDGKLMACIYSADTGLHIVSKYLLRVTDPKDTNYQDCMVVLK